jgi:hypothetical protein
MASLQRHYISTGAVARGRRAPGPPVAQGPSSVWLAVVTAMRISSQYPETKSFVFAFPLPLTRLSICLCVARAATEASKLPIARDNVFLRRAA